MRLATGMRHPSAMGADAPVAGTGDARLAFAEKRFEEVVYRISHDLGAPVRAVSTIPRWIREDLAEAGLVLPATVAQHLGLLEVQAHRLHVMIADLLAYSRVGRAQTEFRGPGDELIAAVIADIPGAEDFEIRLSLAAGMPRIGAEDLAMILRALLSNAVKHHTDPPGRIEIATGIEDDALVLTVTDDGGGIPAEDRSRALGFMTTLRARDEVEGSGMGLPIAGRVCEANGGRLELSAPANGVGCRVRAVFPPRPVAMAVREPAAGH